MRAPWKIQTYSNSLHLPEGRSTITYKRPPPKGTQLPIVSRPHWYTVLVSPELMQTVVFPLKIFPLKLKTHTFKFPPIQIFRTYFPNHYFPLHLFPNTFMQTEVKYLAKKEIKQPVIVPSPFMLFSVIITPLQLDFVKTLGFFVWEFVVLQAIT